MKITSIKTQVKKAAWYSIFVDDKYSFSLSEISLVESKLAVGQEINSSTIGRLKELSGEDKAYNRSLHYLSIRARSEWEMAQYLKRKQVADQAVAKILRRLRRVDLLDDLKFARSWVETRNAIKPRSIVRLRQELRQKHIEESITDKVLADLKVDDGQVIEQIIIQKRRQSKYQDNQKLMQYLARQGFRYNDIKTAVMKD
ncbi:MAG TPA: RecX family transcriptional regulator [Candidatus Saccharimonadales bacterium]|nr:RecX family transcriptional regulator [Candidatus Saccharimonadales bacterium]